ncbi:alpha-ketoglutarate-dependent sulfonate dioxygenase [[Candida] railenensis]|uniref:Alpha-ketoglutarate-dependent sulfonate dioxygenase n=1 Tax=[Candida] railenensis TaxID=45579 RepID=A0A9P0W181_9ASCO|nr:alpha-ketoglutarate-dependent sulfonate dioxygenase [[Candida] railenensis]
MSNYYIYGSELNDPIIRELVKNAPDVEINTESPDWKEEVASVKYPDYLHPTEPEDEGKYNAFTNPDGAKNDKGHLGDKTFKNLFAKKSPKFSTFDLSPNLGTEIDGIQLSELDDAGKNDLALFIETRGLVVFRNQDLRDKSPQFSSDFGKYFGPLHVHPISLSPKGHPELLVTYRKAGDSSRYAKAFAGTHNLGAWHSDISFEEYPASFSFFVALEAPPSGGDTVFLDTREAYRRLSPPLQKFFESLTVIHSNYYQNLRGLLKNKVPKVKADYFTEHPLVRTHPVTGEKALFYSRAFVQRIKGVKPHESAAILNLLNEHVLNNPEFQVRATHRGTDSRTVIAWDNRLTLHTATTDFLQHETGPRHHYRITVLGEKPYLEQEDEAKNGQSNGHSNGHANGLSNGSSK